MIEYKGYVGVFEFEEKSNLFRGKLSNIDDLVTFQGKSKKVVQEAFKDAVDEYVAWYNKYRKKKEKPNTFPQKTGGGGE
jgi:predicted HicB family RNase H-like nuclease